MVQIVLVGPKGQKVQYLHSDVETLKRTDILTKLRQGTVDVLVGINLLREGLDLPEVSLVAILDADKEGFLRSKISLIQTMGRAARHVQGEVILYADRVTKSMQGAIDEVERRRVVQLRYNKAHHIRPQSIQKPIRGSLVEDNPVEMEVDARTTDDTLQTMTPHDKKQRIVTLKKLMQRASKDLDFEQAARLRDLIKTVEDSYG